MLSQRPLFTRPRVLAAAILLVASCDTSVSPRSSARSQVDRYGLSGEEYDYVVAETVAGGRLDFATALEAEVELFEFGDTLFNRRDMALVMWGGAMKRLGVTSEEGAIALYEQIQSASASDPEREAIRIGYQLE